MNKQSTKSKSKKQVRKKRSVQRSESIERTKVLSLREGIRESLIEEIRDAVTATAEDLVVSEVRELLGEPWSRKGECCLRRGGRAKSRIFLGGEPVHIDRPRVRDVASGSEHPLQTFQALKSRDALDDDVHRLMVRGVTMRNYDDALGQLSDGLGLKKSAVSESFQRASQKDLDAINGRSLSDWVVSVVYIDGVDFAGTMCLVAVGITQDGQKKVLGLREGATENSTVVKDLLAALKDRGLQTPKRTLFVLDGSKALKKAVRSAFGDEALVQRCHLHKIRNILSYLPNVHHVEARRRLNVAWGMVKYDDAKAELERVLAWLKTLSTSAANSLEEAFHDSLTVHALGITGGLRKTLVTTNPIESAFDIVRTLSRRVKRWNGTAMVLRWAGSGLVRAEAQFRRVKGFKELPQLLSALDDDTLCATKNVA